jgi:hypothetical protein
VDFQFFIPQENIEAGATFDNSFFDNSFGFLRQFKNRSFLDPVFVHAMSKSELIEVKCCPVYLRLILSLTFGLG